MNWFSTNQFFVSLPIDEPLVIAWPTPNRSLHGSFDKFFAKTRVNPDYGKPGFTRDCGQRFHRGCDIAPCYSTQSDVRTRVMFTDCTSGKDFESDEPSFTPYDEIFSVVAGIPVKIEADETKSDFGKHIILKHVWPKSGKDFYTLYAHLARISCKQGMPVLTGKRIGQMGQTSRSVSARTWMAIAPHLHFEVRNEEGKPYNPVDFLKAYLCGNDGRTNPVSGRAEKDRSITDSVVPSEHARPRDCNL